MQLYAALVAPPSNHLIETFGLAKDVFLTLLKDLYQWMRLACSAQNESGSLIEAAYIARYLASSM
jgi:hypothetical protein